MKRYALLGLLLLLVMVGVSAVAAQVVPPCTPPPCRPGETCTFECPPIIVDPPIGGVFTNPDWLKVDHHRVNVEVENQIARVNIDLEFVNEGNGLAEGTFVFPLPANAAVDNLVMYINGQPIEAKILPADEARNIYNEIVRQYRDPALLEYVGTQALQANVFPIPPGEVRRIEIGYSYPLEVDNGLIRFVYPLDVSSLVSNRPVEQVSISVDVVSNDEISNIYSPSHSIAMSRGADNRSFRAGFEQNGYVPDQGFSLYYGLANEEISVNLLTYRESASDDGFFMLLVQPPISLPEDRIQPRDIILVLDQSGSMSGGKWEQAQEAAKYVLENLNPRDRFNVVLFSTGWRNFSNQLESPDVAEEAIDWIYNMFPEGGTGISDALTAALEMADPERDTTILFMTDGLATEGIVDTQEILDMVEQDAPQNVRLFTFGVGDDVDTVLLDSLVRNRGGVSTYVRPNDSIEEEVASLYNKIGAPVLTDVSIDFGGINTNTSYPAQPLPDLFAGTQLTLVGRYRDSATDTTITISGEVDGQPISYVYDGLAFRDRAGGEPFVARLWATRRIGDLLNTIRLNGENQELIDSVVNLSVRYGIITPYTSFLIEEDDILTQTGRDAAADSFRDEAANLAGQASGAAAVDAAQQFGEFEAAEAPAVVMMPSPQATMTASPAMMPQQGQPGVVGGAPVDDGSVVMPYQPSNPVQTVGGKTFLWQDGVWTDTTFEPDTMQTEQVVFLSDAYFELLTQHPELGEYFAIGERVIVVLDDVAYEVVPE